MYLDTIAAHSPTTWMVTLKILGKEITFKVDTGAAVSAVSKECHEFLGKPTLQKPSKSLQGPDSQSLNVIGTISHKGKSCKQHIFVVDNLRVNLLGLPGIVALNLVARIDSITDYTVMVEEKFPSLFRGLSTLGDPYTIQLKTDAKPKAIYTARKVPLRLREAVEMELKKMESSRIISRVDVPTPWCSGIVPVPKKSGAVRICVDLKALNESVLREVYPLPTVDDLLGQLTGATVFSRLDANSGFWQIPLCPESRLLTTFITPCGRFCFNKLPFGIASAPELFQKRMSKLLSGLDGIVCQMDDVLIFGRTKDEHDIRLMKALDRIHSAGVTLNREKCLFGQDSLKFLGHVVNKYGISADPDKVTAIKQMEAPQNISALRRFLGMVNQLGKFSPRLATTTQPLRALLSKKANWCWSVEQQAAFQATKEELMKPTVLALYNPKAKTKVSADASSFGLGGVLLQQDNRGWHPVAFASRSLTEVEQRYVQIEKEALATVWACEKFAAYLVGGTFSIETDHKPLVPLLGTKHLDCLASIQIEIRPIRLHYSSCAWKGAIYS